MNSTNILVDKVTEKDLHNIICSCNELNYFILLIFNKGRRGGVVTQRTANPWTPVRIRSSPPFIITKESIADYNVLPRE